MNEDLVRSSPRPSVSADGQMSITAYRQHGDYPKSSARGWSRIWYDIMLSHGPLMPLYAPIPFYCLCLTNLSHAPLHIRFAYASFPHSLIPFVLSCKLVIHFLTRPRLPRPAYSRCLFRGSCLEARELARSPDLLVATIIHTLSDVYIGLR
jgi:hypothetical protein